MTPTACFVAASRQNVFFAELQDALGDALATNGIAVEHAVDQFPAPRDGLVYVFVPHELFPFVMPDAHPSATQLSRSIVLCTEQPGTHWFEETAAVAARAARTIDINRLGVAALNRLGIDARFLQLGYSPRWDHWQGSPDAQRPVDVTLLAGATQRRLRAVARCGRQLAGRRTELHLPEALVPHQAGSQTFVSGERKWELLSQSRLILNVHRGELAYFEWQRAAEAIANGAVLLSEHSLGFEPLVPGEHFISVSYNALDVALEGALGDEQRLARMRQASYSLLRDRHPLSGSIEVLAEAVAEVAARAARQARASGRPSARPRPPRLPPPAWELVSGDAALHSDAGDAAPRGSGSVTVVDGEAAPDVREPFGTRAPGHARLSVLMAIAGEASSAADAIEAVGLNDAGAELDWELIVIRRATPTGHRDAPWQRREDALHRALARLPWITGELVTIGCDGSLAEARNHGAEIARGELLLVLGAGVEPYPHAIRRLAHALDRDSDATFAYGMVEQHRLQRPESLHNYLAWDPYRLRYGPLVEDMILLRRAALIDVGGYPTDEQLEGWEDFALSCAFADRGWRGVGVPEVVGRRSRVTAVASMPADGDPAAAWRVLRGCHSCLSSA